MGVFAGAASALCATSTKNITTSAFTLVEQTLKFESLPSDLKDYRIAFVSDIHYGPFVPDAWIEKIFGIVAEAQPDLICLGGDYTNVAHSPISHLCWVQRNPKFLKGKPKEMLVPIYSNLVPLLKQIETPPDGCLAVLGNHDGWLNAALCKQALEDAGIELLVNQSKSITRGKARLSIVGVDDFWTGIPKLPAYDPQIEKNEFRLLLAHNPDYISQTLKHTSYEFNLALAGHTHGGQIRLPAIGAISYNVFNPRFGSGLVWQKKDCAIYTSAGTGVVEIPHRVNCNPEITLIQLARA